MLKSMKKKKFMKAGLWFLAISMILALGLFGTAYLVADLDNGSAGKIFGKKVKSQTYLNALRDVQMQAQMQYGDKFNEASQFLNFPAKAWEHLILLKEADKKKIKASDEEVIQFIEGRVFFQRDGKFDTLLYNDILRFSLKIQSREFEEAVRDTLRIAKLFEMVTLSVTLIEKDVYDQFKKLNEKIQVSYLLLQPEKFKDQVSVTEEEITNYFNNNKSQFEMPPSINVEYASFPFPEGADETAKDIVRKQADELYDNLLNTFSLSSSAQSENITTQKTGFFSQENPNLSLGWPLEFFSQIFNLNLNEFNIPFESQNSIILAQVIELKDSYEAQLIDVKDEVKSELQLNKARVLAREAASKYQEQLTSQYDPTQNNTFSALVQSFGLEISQTPEFRKGQYLPKVGLSRSFQEAAFQLTDKNKISDIVETQIGYTILHLDLTVPANEDDFKDQKEKIEEKLLDEKRAVVWTNYLSRLKLKANIIDEISEKLAN